MNIKRYAQEYSKFHRSFSYDLVNDLIIIPFSVWTWDNSKVLRLRYFDKVQSNNTSPLVQAFKVYLKTDAICSVFLSKDTCSLLIGNEKLIIPESKGTLKLCATSYFVKDAKVLEQYTLNNFLSRTPFPNIYLFNQDHSILFLDELDVPCPGGNYFDKTIPQKEYYRICFLTTNPDPTSLTKNLNVLEEHVKIIPFFSKITTIPLPPFFPIETVNDASFPDSYIKSTAMVDKKDIHFLIRDILNTYVKNGGYTDNLGLFIEYPIRLGFEGCGDHSTGNEFKQFLPISINGNKPKSVLQVQCPYDRYTEYTHIPEVPWIRLLYDTSHVPLNLHRVVVDSVILGYGYRGAFFCLTYPMLEIKPGNLNTEYLLSVVEEDFPLHDDKEMIVIDSYRYDCNLDINRVKHRELPHDLWCLSKRKKNNDNNLISETSTYSKTVNLPDFVRHWLTFYNTNKEKKGVRYGNLEVVKLALVLARHKICYSVKTSSKDHEVFFEKGKDILFRLDAESIDFINDIRLDDIEMKRVDEDTESQCNVM